MQQQSLFQRSTGVWTLEKKSSARLSINKDFRDSQWKLWVKALGFCVCGRGLLESLVGKTDKVFCLFLYGLSSELKGANQGEFPILFCVASLVCAPLSGCSFSIASQNSLRELCRLVGNCLFIVFVIEWQLGSPSFADISQRCPLLNQGLFGSILLNLQVSGDFHVILVLFISS